MTLEEIKSNWTATDAILYKTPEIKLASLEAAKTKVIAKVNIDTKPVQEAIKNLNSAITSIKITVS